MSWSSLCKNPIHDKPILTIIYQPWSPVSKAKLDKWKSHERADLKIQTVSCLDSESFIKKFNIIKYPAAVMTDIYGDSTMLFFEEPWSLISLELQILG